MESASKRAVEASSLAQEAHAASENFPSDAVDSACEAGSLEKLLEKDSLSLFLHLLYC